jgi:hypothetical protein
MNARRETVYLRLLKRQQGIESPAPVKPRPSLLITVTTWAFPVCAAVAIGYSVWALYGSGTRVVSLEATAAASASVSPGAPAGAEPGVLGPISLDPAMNPLRALLRAAYAPVGSNRLRYEVELVDAAGLRLWEKRGALGNKDDQASLMMTTASLGEFDVARAGTYFVRVRTAGGSRDDLRAATLELRRNVVRADARIPGAFGLAALACLIASNVAWWRSSRPGRREEVEWRRAA